MLDHHIADGNPTIRLRPVSDDDIELLMQIYASTRQSEMAQVPWSAEEKENFLGFQFNAQHTYYEQQFPHAQRDVIIVDDVACGRLYLDPRDDELRLIDIALMPAACGHGVGSRLLQAVLAVGAERRLPVTIHVEQNNPALRLYQRLGFTQIEEQGIYCLMRWMPNSDGPTI